MRREGIFDELVFSSFAKSSEALKRNGFSRYIENALIQSIYRPPSPPFHRISCPNLLYSIFWTDTLVSEKDTLEKIVALFKNYEPGFFRGGFKSGVRGRADPQYSSASVERLKETVRNGFRDEQTAFAEASIASTLDAALAKDGAEADPRINWRVTAIHGDYYIHVMALDQGLSRFACCLQSFEDFEESLKSGGRSLHTRYQTGTLAEVEALISEFYSYLKADDERRRQHEEERRMQDRVDTAVKTAVEKERERHMSFREVRELLLEVFFVSLFLLLIVFLPDLFSSDRIEVKLKKAFLTLAALMLLSSPFVYSFRKTRKESEKTNRAFDELNRRKEEAAERLRLYEESYQAEGKALKKLVLDDLEALAEGKKDRITLKTVEAVEALQSRQGEHPDTVAAWAPVIEDFRAGVLSDPKAKQAALFNLSESFRRCCFQPIVEAIADRTGCRRAASATSTWRHSHSNYGLRQTWLEFLG
jgi:hypothetical protein